MLKKYIPKYNRSKFLSLFLSSFISAVVGFAIRYYILKFNIDIFNVISCPCISLFGLTILNFIRQNLRIWLDEIFIYQTSTGSTNSDSNKNYLISRMDISDLLNPTPEGSSGNPTGGTSTQPTGGSQSSGNQSAGNTQGPNIHLGFSIGPDGKYIIDDPTGIAPRGSINKDTDKPYTEGNQPYATNLANAMDDIYAKGNSKNRSSWKRFYDSINDNGEAKQFAGDLYKKENISKYGTRKNYPWLREKLRQLP